MKNKENLMPKFYHRRPNLGRFDFSVIPGAFPVEICYNRGHGAKPMNPTLRTSLKPGQRVRIVLKPDQATGKLTEGVVKDILTNSPTHPHGIKVRLTSGAVGRVKEILD
jgi:uncharacterized repeat protein (TIGR03833 family)